MIASATPAACAEAPVQLEVATQPGFPLTGSHKWMQALGKLDFANVRIRSARTGEQPDVQSMGTEASPAYRVVGLLTPQDQLLLPGGRFRITQGGQINRWIANLRQTGGDSKPQRKAAFGLTSKELVNLHESLATPIRGKTQGISATDAVRLLAKQTTPSVVVDPKSFAAFSEAAPVADNLSGVSLGTGLAAVVRPLGLVVVPRKWGDDAIQLFVTDFQNAPEAWPIGWPPEDTPRELAPKLFDFLSLEIQDSPLSQVLAALSERVGIPMLFDHNSIAQNRVDLSQKVSLPTGRTYYLKAIDRALFQAGLKAELRVDEASKPLLWITSLR